jgi:hypothetical protein
MGPVNSSTQTQLQPIFRHLIAYFEAEPEQIFRESKIVPLQQRTCCSDISPHAMTHENQITIKFSPICQATSEA